MATFLATFAAFCVAVLALSIGLLDGRSLRGSCGGPDRCTCTMAEARTCPRRAARQ